MFRSLLDLKINNHETLLNAPRGGLSFIIKFLGRTAYIAPYTQPFLKSLPSGICPHHSLRRPLPACPGPSVFLPTLRCHTVGHRPCITFGGSPALSLRLWPLPFALQQTYFFPSLWLLLQAQSQALSFLPETSLLMAFLATDLPGYLIVSLSPAFICSPEQAIQLPF